MDFDPTSKDVSLFALIAGVIAIVVIFFPLAILLMGVFAFAIGLINFLKDKQDFMALITMIIGLLVIIICVWWLIL